MSGAVSAGGPSPTGTVPSASLVGTVLSIDTRPPFFSSYVFLTRVALPLPLTVDHQRSRETP